MEKLGRQGPGVQHVDAEQARRFIFYCVLTTHGLDLAGYSRSELYILLTEIKALYLLTPPR